MQRKVLGRVAPVGRLLLQVRDVRVRGWQAVPLQAVGERGRLRRAEAPQAEPPWRAALPLEQAWQAAQARGHAAVLQAALSLPALGLVCLQAAAC